MRGLLSVTQLNRYIKGVFEDELVLQNIDVYGEISEFHIAGGNTYLTLKDGDNIIGCVYFGTWEEIPVGTKVIVSGSVNFYVRGGRISFQVKHIKIQGEGELYAQFVRLKETLRKEGLFENPRVLPNLIRKVVVVTSSAGAVIHDFISVVHARCPFIDILIYPVRVQGEGAERELAAAIADVNRFLSDADAVVVARGGGSESDLSCFNTEIAARAVYGSDIPVISAVGHETDYTLCDFCASYRAGTPSIAGEVIVSRAEAVIDRIFSLLRGLQAGASERFARAERSVYRRANQIVQKAQTDAAVRQQHVRYLGQRMERAVTGRLNAAYDGVTEALAALGQGADNQLDEGRRRVETLAAVLDRLSPLKILSQGYARIVKEGQIITSAAAVERGDEVDVFLSDGKLKAQIKSKG